MSARALRVLMLLAVLLGVVVLVRLLVGDPERLLMWPESGVILEIRWLRISIALVVGAALGVSGVLLQALLRNPLASPDLIGLSAGASLAVMVALLVTELAGGGGAAAGRFGQTWHVGPALIGALGALAVVIALGRRSEGLDPSVLILIGVIVTVMCGAGVLLIQHMMPRLDATRAFAGSISESSRWWQVFAVGGLTLAGTAVGVGAGRAMDVASLSDDEAMSTGVRLARLRLFLLLVSGLLSAGAVVLVGPIGFVGLIAPHAVRRLAGPSHGPLVIGAAVAGAALMVGADVIVSVVPTRSGRLPIGVVTALVGGPAFIVLLRRSWGGGR